MKLFQITNGYMGNSPLHVLVVAETQERAENVATEEFKRDAHNHTVPFPERYWTHLESEVLCENVLEEWNTEVRQL